MRNKTFITLFTLLVLLFSVSSFAAKEDKQKKYADTIQLNIIADIKPEGVTFEHKKHIEEYSLSCTQCHHMYNESAKNAPKPCIECHDLNETKVIEGIRARLLKTSIMTNIYHDTCKPCHEKLQRGGKPFPKKCSVCHPYNIKN
jgi:hypothetical protein